MKNCSLFAVYDGHGGEGCCNKLKEVFHRYLLRNFKFEGFEKRLITQCLKFDEDFNQKAKDDPSTRLSGSCAVTLIVLDDLLIFVNVGDSRAIYSKNKGLRLKSATYDHKPQFFSEMNRVFKNGGQLYRMSSCK